MLIFTGILFGIILLAMLALAFRSPLGIFLATHFMKTPPLIEKSNKESGEWFDDYYTVEKIDDHTYAIGEPRYHQENFHYLLLGETRAILLDTGAGLRDISKVVKSITKLPVTALPSHLHYDHVGGCDRFEHVALIDLPNLRKQEKGGKLKLTNNQHLGSAEGIANVTLTINEWLAPGSVIDLGGRKLEVIHTPGHVEEHLVLFDEDNKLLFTSDYLYDGPLYAFLPGGNLTKYLKASEELLQRISKSTRLFGAHRSSSQGVPELGYQDLQDLRDTLTKVLDKTKKGTGFYPYVYQVNDKIELHTDIPFLQKK